MAKYTAKRLFQSLISVLIVATVVFLLLRALPSDYFFSEDQLMKLTEEQKEDQLRAAGLLDPMVVQLTRFWGEIICLDFGVSRRIQIGVPVMTLVAKRFAVSMRLGLIALGVSYAVGLTLGIFQARYKDKLIDHFGTVYTVISNSVPALVLYSLVLVFGTKVLKLPAMYSTRNAVMASILPIACMSIKSIANRALWMRRYMVDEINRDYIKLARVKGLSTRQIMFRHIFRNAFVPMAAGLPASILLTINGSLLAERFFSIPGMGGLLTDAVGRYDVNVVQSLVILYSALGIIGVFLGDILMMIFDPRITLTGKRGTR